MTILLPGWGQALGNAAAQAGQTVQDIANPNYDLQQKIKASLTDPTELQKYANAYLSDPNAFNNNAKVFGNKNLAILKQTAADPQFILDRAKAAAGNQLLTTGGAGMSETQTSTGETALGIGSLEHKQLEQLAVKNAQYTDTLHGGILDAIKNLPKADRDQYFKEGGILATTGMSAPDRALAQDRLAKLDDMNSMLSAGTDYLKANPNLQPKDIAQQIHDGTFKGSAAAQAGILNHNVWGPLVQNQINEINKKEDTKNEQDFRTQMQTNAIDATAGRQDKSLQLQQSLADQRSLNQQKRESSNMANQFSQRVLQVTGMLSKNGPNDNPPDLGQLNSGVVPALQQQLNRRYELEGLGAAPTIKVVDQNKSTGLFGTGAFKGKAQPALVYTDPTTGKDVDISGKGELDKVVGGKVGGSTDASSPVITPKIQAAIDLLKSGKGKIEDLMSSNNYSDDEKAAIKKAAGGS